VQTVQVKVEESGSATREVIAKLRELKELQSLEVLSREEYMVYVKAARKKLGLDKADPSKLPEYHIRYAGQDLVFKDQEVAQAVQWFLQETADTRQQPAMDPPEIYLNGIVEVLEMGNQERVNQAITSYHRFALRANGLTQRFFKECARILAETPLESYSDEDAIRDKITGG
jgi:hypothetical protein